MALDAMTIGLLSKELDTQLQGARIDKIHQPSKDEVVVHLRRKDSNVKLLISARSGSARVCITNESFENPQTPPSFCMLLRKYLGGAKFINASNVEGERIIFLFFSATNDMGDTVKIKLAIELMGRYANIVVVNSEEKIIDALKKVDADASSVRQLLPGIDYILPPNKENPRLNENAQQVIDQVFNFEGLLNQAFMKNCQGIGPVIAREIHTLANTNQTYADSLSQEQQMAVISSVGKVLQYYSHPVYTTIYDEDGKPIEFSFMPLTQYTGLGNKKFETLNILLDEYYAKKDKAERLKQKSKDLHRLSQNLIDRTIRKQAARHQELKDSINSEHFKIYGELLTANLYQIQKGMKNVEVLNYYNNETIKINLDEKLTPNQNAQKYYKEYKKRQTAVKMLDTLIAQGDIELEYFKSINYAIEKADTETELMQIRNELHSAGYLKYYKNKEKKQKPQDFIKYTSSDGFLILVGRNNLQNDKLTMKTARGKDLWFHTKNAPGSHVVVMSEGQDIPLATQNEAAMIAVHHSSQTGSSKVAVDYTFVRNIKKTSDLKPGMVIYDTNETAYITPEIEIINKLRIN